MKVAIVGAGRLAATLAPGLRQAGHTVTEIISRPAPSSLARARKLAHIVGATAVTSIRANLDANLIWFCVPDGRIKSAAQSFADRDWKNKTAFHSSGALASDELQALKQCGARVASVHPLMTFVRNSRPELKGVPFALEGDHAAVLLARRVVVQLGGESFSVAKQDKALYHAWGTFASPLLIALLATTEQVARAAGISVPAARKRMLPILRQTLNNYADLGPARAFSGPIVRGDADVLARHLKALKKIPQAAEVYRALARAALQYLPAQNKKGSNKVFLGEP